MMFKDKRGGVLGTVLVLVAILGIFLVGSFAIKYGVDYVKSFNIGIEQNVVLDYQINVPSWLGGEYVAELFAPNGDLTIQLLLLGLIVFFMLAVAFTDILSTFSTFRKLTANYLGVGLAVIAVLTGVLRGILVWFGFTAGLGAVSIGVVMIGAFVVFALINFTIGSKAIMHIKEAKDLRQVSEAASETKTAFYGARKTADAIKSGNEQAAKEDE